MTVSDCEFEMSEYEYEMTVYGMTWMSLTRMILTWVSMRKYDKSECTYEWHKVIHFMYKIWSVTYFLFFWFFPDLRAKKSVKILKKVQKNLMFSLYKKKFKNRGTVFKFL